MKRRSYLGSLGAVFASANAVGAAEGSTADVTSGSVQDVSSSAGQNEPTAIFGQWDGAFHATNFRTGNSFSDPSDPGVVINAVIDDMFRSRPKLGATGKLFVLPGKYRLQTPVVVDYPDMRQMTVESIGQTKSGKHATEFTPGSNFDDSAHDYLWTFGREDPENPGTLRSPKAPRVIGIAFSAGGAEVHPLRIFGCDGWDVYYCSFGGVQPGYHGLRVDGGNEGLLVRSTVTNFYLHKNPVNPHIGTNHLMSNYSAFQTDDNRLPMDMEGDGYMITNFIVNARPNNQRGAGDTPAVNPGCKRIRWANGEFVGGGGSGNGQLVGVSRMKFTNINFSGETPSPNIRNPFRCEVTNSRFYSPGRSFFWNDTNGRSVVINGCDFVGYGDNAGEPAIETTGKSRHDGVVITGNAFMEGEDRQADVKLGWIEGPAVVSDNVMKNGVWNRYADETGYWEGRFDRDNLVLVEGNAGFNPIGTSRPTPSLPSGPGERVGNPGHQPVSVFQSGGTGVTLEEPSGTRTTLPGSPASLTLPPQGAVQFESSVPDEWVWRWH